MVPLLHLVRLQEPIEPVLVHVVGFDFHHVVHFLYQSRLWRFQACQVCQTVVILQESLLDAYSALSWTGEYFRLFIIMPAHQNMGGSIKKSLVAARCREPS